METSDAVIVGAGPAGLTAATYLGRFRHRALGLDGGPSRASWIPTSHNTPGFPQAVGGLQLLVRLRDQAERYGTEIRAGRAGEMVSTGSAFEFATRHDLLRSRFAILATGVVDRKPELGGQDAAVRRSLVRICPICDAYER